MNAAAAVDATKFSLPTVNSLLDRFREMGIVIEVTGRKRDRKYLYRSLLATLDTASRVE